MASTEGFSASDFTNNTLLEGYDTKILTTNHVNSAKKKLAEDANHALSEVVGTLENRYPGKPYNIAEDILDITDAIASLESFSDLRLNKPKAAEKIDELLDQCADGVPMTLMANHVKSVITGDYTLKEKARELESLQAFLRILKENGVMEKMTPDVKQNLKQVLTMVSETKNEKTDESSPTEPNILRDMATIQDRNTQLALEVFGNSDIPQWSEIPNPLTKILENYFSNGFGDNWHKLDLLEKFAERISNSGKYEPNDIGFKLTAIVGAIYQFQQTIPVEGSENIWNKLKQVKNVISTKAQHAGIHSRTVSDANRF